MLANFKCPICGNNSCKILLTVKQPDRFEKALGISENNYSRYWVECLGCGVSVNINSPENCELLKSLSTSYYEVDFQKESISDKYDKIMSLPRGKSDNALRVLRIHDFVKKWFNRVRGKGKLDHKVLDIGAGTGVFLSRFIDLSKDDDLVWKGTAIEPDPMACKHLRALGKFEVIETSFFGQPEYVDFDLCTLNKIVEHVENPLGFMKCVRNVISKNRGLLYLEVPDIMTIFHRVSSDNILGSVHYHLYNCLSDAYLLRASGFILLEVSRILEPSGKLTIVAFATLPHAFNVLVDSGKIW